MFFVSHFWDNKLPDFTTKYVKSNSCFKIYIFHTSIKCALLRGALLFFTKRKIKKQPGGCFYVNLGETLYKSNVVMFYYVKHTTYEYEL